MLSIDIEPGRVVAQVQGSRKRPYDVAITVDTISPEDWEKLKVVMAEQPIIAASLLVRPNAGEHRGNLHGRRSLDVPDAEARTSAPTAPAPTGPTPASTSQPCTCCWVRSSTETRFSFSACGAWSGITCWAPSSAGQPRLWKHRYCPPSHCRRSRHDFWTNPLPTLRDGDFAGPAIKPGTDAALPLQLGKFPLWRSNQPFEDAMKYIYGAASEHAAPYYGSDDETAATEVKVRGLAASRRSSR